MVLSLREQAQEHSHTEKAKPCGDQIIEHDPECSLKTPVGPSNRTRLKDIEQAKQNESERLLHQAAFQNPQD
jgi:hypothetical protein